MPPPPKKDPPLKLILSTNSLRNTTIAVDNDAFYYEIVTRFWHPNVTKLRKLDAETQHIETIAEIERESKSGGKEGRTRLRFGEGEWVGANEWLKKEDGRIAATFQGANGVSYRWKTHKRRLQLVRADGDDKTPLVQYHKYKRHFFVMRMSQYAYLEVQPEVVENLDALIMSYLIVERWRRDSRIQVDIKLA